MNKSTKRLTSAGLSAVMAATLLVGCGGGSNQAESQPEPQSEDVNKSSFGGNGF